ncbi:MAG: Tm-1-like ATP-binding domain-containing protein, partial [Limisphaerales bacterium]
IREIQEKNDRGLAVETMSKGAPEVVAKLASAGKIHGLVSLGGSGGTAICTAAMRALPIGFPKVMVSTMAAGNIAHYVGDKDIVMIPSIVDVAGINRISRKILTQAAGAIAGMVSMPATTSEDKPLIAASMFGNTTDCVNRAQKILKEAGYEVLVFHATGAGGKTMESLIESGMIAGVLDVTTTEWADEYVGGVLNAGPTRLEAAARHGVPAIVAPGCLDMVNFGPPDTVPREFGHRNFYQHNPQVTLMRTNAEECAEIAKIIAEKINLSSAPVTFMIPNRAISVISAPDQKFNDPIADKVLFQAVRAYLRDDIPVRELDHQINDQTFAEACAEELIANIEKAKA